jgi:hypothetical protein
MLITKKGQNLADLIKKAIEDSVITLSMRRSCLLPPRMEFSINMRRLF